MMCCFFIIFFNVIKFFSLIKKKRNCSQNTKIYIHYFKFIKISFVVESIQITFFFCNSTLEDSTLRIIVLLPIDRQYIHIHVFFFFFSLASIFKRNKNKLIKRLKRLRNGYHKSSSSLVSIF